MHDLAREVPKTLKNNRARTVHFNRARTVHFIMKYDLLLKIYDYHCNLFIDGKISMELFFKLESEYLRRRELFLICLN